MTNKERLDANNEKIKEIQETLKRKQVSPTDMLQQMVDNSNSCAYLFYEYQGDNLDFIGGLDTSNATAMGSMCYNSKIKSINLSNFNTSNVKNMNYMFYWCDNLTNLDVSSFNTEKVTNMSYMFHGCNGLTSLDLSNFNTSNVTNMEYMFYGCSALINIIGVLDAIKTTKVDRIFTSCKNLENVTLKNIKVNLQIGSGTSYGHLLTLDSLLNTFKELHTYTGTSPRTLTIGSANLEKIANVYVKLIDITDEMRAEDEYIDNKLPFVQCESTDEGAMTLTEYATSKNWAIA